MAERQARAVIEVNGASPDAPALLLYAWANRERHSPDVWTYWYSVVGKKGAAGASEENGGMNFLARCIQVKIERDNVGRAELYDLPRTSLRQRGGLARLLSDEEVRRFEKEVSACLQSS